jgi:hypothetical protein
MTQVKPIARSTAHAGWSRISAQGAASCLAELSSVLQEFADRSRALSAGARLAIAEAVWVRCDRGIDIEP